MISQQHSSTFYKTYWCHTPDWFIPMINFRHFLRLHHNNWKAKNMLLYCHNPNIDMENFGFQTSSTHWGRRVILGVFHIFHISTGPKKNHGMPWIKASGADCSVLAPVDCHRGRKLGLSLSGVSYWTRCGGRFVNVKGCVSGGAGFFCGFGWQMWRGLGSQF